MSANILAGHVSPRTANLWHTECEKCSWQRNKRTAEAARAELIAHHRRSHPKPTPVYLEDETE